jgi:hypothetical protein
MLELYGDTASISVNSREAVLLDMLGNALWSSWRKHAVALNGFAGIRR